MAELRAALESILFVADQPVELLQLKQVLDVSREVVEDLIGMLAEDCRERGLRVARHKDAVRMVTAPESARYVRAFLGLEQTARLSAAALETLAIVAFRQPVTRGQIEAIRGVNADGVIATLEARGLIEETGHADSLGRPIQYGTTMEFLQHFGLESLEGLRPLQPAG
ncbi:MAG: SMC-Scp complex subunit ScpB [Chloroflexota bacterium]